MTDVGDAVTLTFTTTTGATVTAEVTNPAGATATPTGVTETATSGDYPFTFVPAAAGMWGVTFRATGTVTAVQRRWVRVRALSTVPPLATPEDVAATWRALTAAEEDVASALIDEASLIIRQRVASVDARIAGGTLSAELVASVVARMVRRLMQAPPPGMQSWTVDDYTERYTEVVARLVLDSDDLELLAPAGATSGAFTIRPSYTPPRQRDRSWY
jgi:hypothetical protein